MLRNAPLFAGLLLLCGCASVGQNFEFGNRSKIALGETTRQAAIDLLGKPYKTGSTSDGSISYETVDYLYSHASLGGAAARVMFLEFRDGRLNAFIYSSGFDEDNTDFDHTAVGKIEKGVTKKSEVEALLGKPSGQARCPTSLGDFASACTSCKEVWKWAYTSKSKGLNTSTMKSKSATIGFDSHDVVSFVTSSVDG
jgi:hypothetical protein